MEALLPAFGALDEPELLPCDSEAVAETLEDRLLMEALDAVPIDALTD